MAEGMPTASGKQFAADLRRIREERGLRVADLHESTRIPLTLIESFERSALFDHPMFNRVYLRSFVRTYANFLDISVETALEALDEAIEGNYQGRLAREYLGEEPQVEETREAREPAEDEPEEQPGAGDGEQKEADPTSGVEGEAPAETGGGAPDRGAKAPERPPSPPGRGEPSMSKAAAAEAASETAEPAWDEQSPPGGASQARHSRPEGDGSSALWWGAIALGVLGLVVLLFILLRPPNGMEETGGTSPAEAAVDTSALEDEDEASTEEDSAPARPQLGDLMHLTIVAESGPVRGLRITRDSDLRRPYWIEEGAATVFPAERRIVIENPQSGSDEFEDVRLLLEGYEYPEDERDEQGRLVITRETAQSFLDEQRGAPVTLSVSPDTNRTPALR